MIANVFVKHIDDDAFASNQMEKLTIPEGVITIGRNAFLHCEKLEFVELPHSLTEIHYSALRGCDKLNYIVCPEKIYDKIQKMIDVSKVKFVIKH